jgi:hypothetical protein
MTIIMRFMTGFAVGFEVNVVSGVYLTIYLGIAEIAFVNYEKMENDE